MPMLEGLTFVELLIEFTLIAGIVFLAKVVMGVSVSDLQVEIKTSAVCAGEFVVIAATY